MRKVYKITARLVSREEYATRDGESCRRFSVGTILSSEQNAYVAGEDFTDALSTMKLCLSTLAREHLPNTVVNTAYFDVTSSELVGDLIEAPRAKHLVVVPEAS